MASDIGTNLTGFVPGTSTENIIIAWAKRTYGVDLRIRVGVNDVNVRYDIGKSWAEMIIPYEHWTLTPIATLVSELSSNFKIWGIKPIEEQEELTPPPKKKRVHMGKWKVNKGLLS